MSTEQIGNWAVIIITVLLLGLGLLSMLIGQLERVWTWLMDWRPVKYFDDGGDVVMSRSGNNGAVDPLSSKDGQGDGRTDSLIYTRDELTMFYNLLREYGIPRERARPVLKAMRIPLSNDVWAASVPTTKPTDHITPIAGRRTEAVFDADFPYQAPPA